MFNNIPLVEIIGYAASVLVAISLMMSAIVKLRIINLIGCFIFTAYGLIIGAYPVAFVNGFIAIVNIYYLIEIFSSKEYFDVLEVEYNSEYLKYFLNFHKEDIHKYIPAFSFETKENWKTLFILRNAVPAGLVCAEFQNGDNLFVNLDYVIPGYRDFKIGKYVYQKLFKEKKVKKIFSYSGNKIHEKYLQKMGFQKTELDSKPVYCLEIH